MGKNTPGVNQLYAKNSRHFGRIRREYTRKEEYLELRGRRNGFHRRGAWGPQRFRILYLGFRDSRSMIAVKNAKARSRPLEPFHFSTRRQCRAVHRAGAFAT